MDKIEIYNKPHYYLFTFFDIIKKLTVNTKKKTYVRKNTYAKLRKKHNIIKKDILKLVNRD